MVAMVAMRGLRFLSYVVVWVAGLGVAACGSDSESGGGSFADGGAGYGGGAGSSHGGGGSAGFSGGDGGTVLPSRCGDDPSVEPVVFAGEGALPTTIVIAKDARAETVKAAEELRFDIEQATGSVLALVDDDAIPAEPGNIISIGATSLAKSAGLGAEDFEFDAFRIYKDKNTLFIYGQDNASNLIVGTDKSVGSANGVYVFLEGCLDVRWLMPGPRYRDVPKRDKLVVGAIDRMVSPQIKGRVHNQFVASPTEANDNFEAWTRQVRFHRNYWKHIGGHAWIGTVNRAYQADGPDGKPRMAGIDIPTEDMPCDAFDPNPSSDSDTAAVA